MIIDYYQTFSYCKNGHFEDLASLNVMTLVDKISIPL